MICLPISAEPVQIADFNSEWYPVFVRPRHFKNCLQPPPDIHRCIAFWGNVARLKIKWNSPDGRVTYIIPVEEHCMKDTVTSWEESGSSMKTENFTTERSGKGTIGNHEITEWSTALDKSQQDYDFVATGITFFEEMSNPAYNLLLLDWKGCTAYRAGRASIYKKEWDLIQTTRKLIVMV